MAGGHGTGASLTLTLSSSAPYSVTGTPTILTAGTDYQEDDIIGATGGTSYVPPKVQAAALAFCCESLYKRRLAPNEINPFSPEAQIWRGTAANLGMLPRIGHGELAFIGTSR